MGSTAAVTVETCPTTVEEIANLGRYQMRSLAEQLNIFSSGDEKQAFLRLDVPGQASEVLKAKLEYDKAKSGGGKPASKAVTRTPSTTKATAAAKTTVTASPKETASTGGDNAGAAGAAAVLEKLQELIDAVATANSNVDALRAEMAERFAGTNRLVTTGMAISLEYAELKGDAAPEELLGASIDRVESIEPMLRGILGEEGGESD